MFFFVAPRWCGGQRRRLTARGFQVQLLAGSFCVEFVLRLLPDDHWDRLQPPPATWPKDSVGIERFMLSFWFLWSVFAVLFCLFSSFGLFLLFYFVFLGPLVCFCCFILSLLFLWSVFAVLFCLFSSFGLFLLFYFVFLVPLVCFCCFILSF